MPVITIKFSKVPDWAVQLAHLPPAMIVLGNGAFEVILGSLMATNILVRIPALILALHLIPIAWDFGVNATAIRDYGLVIAALTLAIIYGTRESESVISGNEPVSPPKKL